MFRKSKNQKIIKNIKIKVLLKDSINFQVVRSELENQYFAIFDGTIHIFWLKIYEKKLIVPI